MAFKRPLVYSFWSFQASGKILQQINVKDDSSRMRCKDLNSRLRLLPWPLNQGTCLQSKLFLHFFCSSSRILRIWCLKIFKWNKKWQISKMWQIEQKMLCHFQTLDKLETDLMHGGHFIRLGAFTHALIRHCAFVHAFIRLFNTY